MHVNSHEEDEESAAGHRHLDLQHTMIILNSAWAPALATPPNNNIPQIVNSLTSANTSHSSQVLQAELG